MARYIYIQYTNYSSIAYTVSQSSNNTRAGSAKHVTSCKVSCSHVTQIDFYKIHCQMEVEGVQEAQFLHGSSTEFTGTQSFLRLTLVQVIEPRLDGFKLCGKSHKFSYSHSAHCQHEIVIGLATSFHL
jgi:hypothetical protein